MNGTLEEEEGTPEKAKGTLEEEAETPGQWTGERMKGTGGEEAGTLVRMGGRLEEEGVRRWAERGTSWEAVVFSVTGDW